MVVVGCILLAVAIGLSVGHVLKKRGVDELRGVERRQAGELKELITEIGDEVGEGSYRVQAELVGRVACDEPLVSPLGEKPCLHYEMTVKRVYEETRYTTDSDGRERRRTTRRTDTVSREKQSVPFRIQDDSGDLLVLPEKARFDGLVKTVDKFDRGDTDELSLGRFVMSMASAALGGRRTIGYKYEEHVMPLDRPLTVIGQVGDEMGEVALRRGDGSLIISTRSREEMVASGRRWALALLIMGVVSGAGGVVFLVLGLV